MNFLLYYFLFMTYWYLVFSAFLSFFSLYLLMTRGFGTSFSVHAHVSLLWFLFLGCTLTMIAAVTAFVSDCIFCGWYLLSYLLWNGFKTAVRRTESIYVDWSLKKSVAWYTCRWELIRKRKEKKTQTSMFYLFSFLFLSNHKNMLNV